MGSSVASLLFSCALIDASSPSSTSCFALSLSLQGRTSTHSWLLRQRILRRSRGGRGSADHQHGTRSLSDHVFCHTAQKHVGESRPPMRPHDNQIHSLLVRCVQNRLRGCSLDEEALSLEPGTLDPLSTRLEEVLCIGLQFIQIG